MNFEAQIHVPFKLNCNNSGDQHRLLICQILWLMTKITVIFIGLVLSAKLAKHANTMNYNGELDEQIQLN